MTLHEAIKGKPETEITTEYGYFIGGEFYWKHKGGIFESGILSPKEAPDVVCLDIIHDEQRRLATLSGAILSEDDMAVMVKRQRIVTTAPPQYMRGPVQGPGGF